MRPPSPNINWCLPCCLYEISWSPRNLFVRWRFWDDWRYWKEEAL